MVAIGLSSFVAIWAAAGLVDAVNKLPLIGGLLEGVGLVVSGWFIYRNLIFGPDRSVPVTCAPSCSRCHRYALISSTCLHIYSMMELPCLITLSAGICTFCISWLHHLGLSLQSTLRVHGRGLRRENPGSSVCLKLHPHGPNVQAHSPLHQIPECMLAHMQGGAEEEH